MIFIYRNNQEIVSWLFFLPYGITPRILSDGHILYESFYTDIISDILLMKQIFEKKGEKK